MKYSHALLVALCLLLSSLVSQSQYIAEDLPDLPFLQLDSNKIEFKGDSLSYNSLYRKLDSMILYGKGKVNIVHLGGSHIQAGVLSAQFAKRLQSFYPGLEGSRGFVFPYRLAKTNNPATYRTSYTGSWTSCKSTQKKQKNVLGLSGIAATTHSPQASFRIEPARSAQFLNYTFNKIRLFHGKGDKQFQVVFRDTQNIASYQVNTASGITEIHLKQASDILPIGFAQTSPKQNEFTLHGVLLENDEPGFTYYPIGVNGTTIPSYLRCQLFEEHLSAIRPDWVILTLGTNDAYGKHFYPERYKAHYKELVAKIKAAAPNAVILLTVPNDSYLYRKYPNENTAKTARVIKELSQELNLGMWNFYEVMGGLNSVSMWQEHQLARSDKIHFTGEGYTLQANLLFAAFVHSYENYLRNQTPNR